MAYTAPAVSYSTSLTGTYTTLTGVQSVYISRGRRQFQDNFGTSTCTIELIPANSYSTALAIGQNIDVRDTNSATAKCYFVGIITDIERSYDIPYNASNTVAAPGDRIRITATGGTGMLAGNYLNAYQHATGNLNAFETLSKLLVALKVGGAYVSNSTTDLVEDLVFTGGAYDYVNQVCRTGQVVVDDLDTQRSVPAGFATTTSYVFIYAYGQLAPYQTLLPVFTDTGGAGYKFRNIEYVSSAQTAFTKVLVDPNTGTTSFATYGDPPYNSLVYSTYNVNSTNSQSLANYLVLTNAQKTATPFSITSDTTMSSTITDLARILYAIPSSSSLNYVVGLPITVTFRGATVAATIQGINTTFMPEKATVQLFLSPSLGAPFTLDSTAAGILDTNRLGYP